MTDRPKGRPTVFSPELADAICEHLMMGESLRSICREEAFPDKSTVLRWLANDEDFRFRYAFAKQLSTDARVERIFTIADDARNDWVPKLDRNGRQIGWELNWANIERAKLRIDAEKWILSKLAPKKYGSRVVIERLNRCNVRAVETTVSFNFCDTTADSIEQLQETLDHARIRKGVEPQPLCAAAAA